MSVLIKGMEMPKNCCACPLFKSNMSKQLFCKAFGSFDRSDYDKLPIERMKNCPLVEVKAPHGRLVDEDAIGWRYEEERAHNQVVEVARQNGCDSPACQYYDAYYDGILTMTGKIRFAPTIIEEEG